MRTVAFIDVAPPEPTARDYALRVAAAARRAVHVGRADFQILRWLPRYTWALFRADALASVVVGTMLLPQAMAYAILAGLPAQYGLYSSIFPSFVYGIITSCGVLAPGPVAASSILIAAQVRGLTTAAPLSDEWVAMALQLSAVVGVVQLLLGVLRFGDVARLLSYPVMAGFTAAAAVLIILSQAPGMLGIASPPAGDSSFIKFGKICAALPRADWRACVLGFGSLLILVYGRQAFRRATGRVLPRWLPLPLLVTLAGALVSWAAALGPAGVAVVGPIPRGLPTPTAPTLPASGAAFVALLPPAILTGLVAYVQTVSLALTFGRRAGDAVNANTELLALGATSLVGTCFGAYAVTGSITRTALQAASGAKTPASVILCGLFMLAATLGLAPLFSVLPIAVLGAVIVASALSMLDVGDAVSLWRARGYDFLAFLVTAVVILAIDIQTGLLAGVGTSVLLLMRHLLFAPRIVELGLLPGTDVFVALPRSPQATRVAAARVFRVDGEIHFGNVAAVAAVLRGALAEAVAERAAAAAAAAAAAGGGAGAGGASPATATTAAAAAVRADGSSGSGTAAADAAATGPCAPPPAMSGGTAAAGTAIATAQPTAATASAAEWAAGAVATGLPRPTLGSASPPHKAPSLLPAARSGGADTPARDRGAAFAATSTRRAAPTMAEPPVTIPAGGSVRTVFASVLDEGGRGGGGAGDGAGFSSVRLRRRPAGAAAAVVADAGAFAVDGAHRGGGGPPVVAVLGGSSGASAIEGDGSDAATADARHDGHGTAHASHVSRGASGGGDGAAAAVAPLAGDDDSSAAPPVPVRAVVVDGCRVVDIDVTAWRELRDVGAAYTAQRMSLVWAALPGPVRDTIERVDAAEARRRGVALPPAVRAARGSPPLASPGGVAAAQGATWWYLSVFAAVSAVQRGDADVLLHSWTSTWIPPAGGVRAPPADALPPPVASPTGAGAAGAATARGLPVTGVGAAGGAPAGSAIV